MRIRPVLHAVFTLRNDDLSPRDRRRLEESLRDILEESRTLEGFFPEGLGVVVRLAP